MIFDESAVQILRMDDDRNRIVSFAIVLPDRSLCPIDQHHIVLPAGNQCPCKVPALRYIDLKIRSRVNL